MLLNDRGHIVQLGADLIKLLVGHGHACCLRALIPFKGSEAILQVVQGIQQIVGLLWTGRLGATEAGSGAAVTIARVIAVAGSGSSWSSMRLWSGTCSATIAKRGSKSWVSSA